MARHGRPCVSISCLPHQVYLAGPDRAGLAAAQHLHRTGWAAAHTLLDAVQELRCKVRASPVFYAEQELRPVGPAPPLVSQGRKTCFTGMVFRKTNLLSAAIFQLKLFGSTCSTGGFFLLQ